MALRASLLVRPARLLYAARWSNGSSDKAGSIRDAGGVFGKREKAQEDQYFRNLEREKLAKLREEAEQHHEEEIGHHEEEIDDLQEQIRRHQEKIRRHKQKMADHDGKDD